MGFIYIMTNPSFSDEWVKIGYADDVDARLKQLNASSCTPYAFRVYATYEVKDRVSDRYVHDIIDLINPELRSIEHASNGKDRVREFFAMTPDDAYHILENIANLTSTWDKLKFSNLTADDEREEEAANTTFTATYLSHIKSGGLLTACRNYSVSAQFSN